MKVERRTLTELTVRREPGDTLTDIDIANWIAAERLIVVQFDPQPTFMRFVLEVDDGRRLMRWLAKRNGEAIEHGEQRRFA